MSIGFLLKDRGDSVVWRGPKKDGMIRQFLAEVRWGDLDYLVIDTPPGELVPYLLMTPPDPIYVATRYIGRTHFPVNASASSLPTESKSPATNVLPNADLRSYYDAANDGTQRYPQIALLYPKTLPPRPRTRREHGRLRLPMLRRDQ
jgi:hypothetical protein